MAKQFHSNSDLQLAYLMLFKFLSKMSNFSFEAAQHNVVMYFQTDYVYKSSESTVTEA